jgi:hypothetical protein
VQAPP